MEETSFRISKTFQFGEDDIFYRADCGCGCKDCGLELELELQLDEGDEKLDNYFCLNIFQDTHYFDWSNGDEWYRRCWSRIKTILRVLFIGKIKLSSEFIFRGEKQVKAFITALEEGSKMIEGSRE